MGHLSFMVISEVFHVTVFPMVKLPMKENSSFSIEYRPVFPPAPSRLQALGPTYLEEIR